MKRFFVSMALLCSIAARADEGMWLPQLLGQQVYQQMKAKGLKLTAEQLYSINKASVKDAILIFGSGCTGEIVSPDGLIFTNHHCGYSAIASASTVDHNYLRDGFYAKSRDAEIPSAGLSVQFLIKIDDVSRQVTDSMARYPNWTDWQTNRDSVFARIGRGAVAGTGNEGRVYSLFKDNQFLLYTFQRYKDIRLAGTPPESIGKFGGDTDNWEWPRHTGDFSIFRVYASPDGKPAEYSTSNVPLKAKYFLPISLKGTNDGSFSMIFGYPGSTNRFETSYGVKLETDVRNPAYVYMRDIRLKAMFEEMRKDPAIKLQLASSYAGLANYWKFYDGETKQLLKYDIYGKKKINEAAFSAWAKGKPEYENIWKDYENAYTAWQPYEKHRQYYTEGITGPQIIKFAQKMVDASVTLTKAGVADTTKRRIVANLDADRTRMLKDLNRTSEMNMLARITQAYYTDIPTDQQPVSYFTNIKQQWGSLKEADTYNKLAGNLFSNTIILDDTRWRDFVSQRDASLYGDDPAFLYAYAFQTSWNSKYKPLLTRFTNITADLGHKYLKGWLEMNAKKVAYPDANSSMRVSFGQVKTYKPRDAVTYDYVCTMKGVIEKYIPGDYEFDLPPGYVDRYNKKDFGQYADPKYKDVVVTFITTNDITGGNSGSPVLNANGELIGLAFDGNYEALSHKINFDKDLNRTICVDVRYVLWCMEKLGGATNLINELKLVKAGTTPAK